MKKNTQPTTRSIMKRMPKGWKHVGTNALSSFYKVLTFEERAKSDHTWMLAIKQAEKDGKKFAEEMAKRKIKLKEEEVSNAEVLVNKKYKKDKTSTKLG